MTEVSGQPIVNKSDSVIATYLKPQDWFMNPPQGSNTVFTVPNLTINDQLLSGTGNLNVAGGFTTSGRTITAAGSGVFAPLGFFGAKVSGNSVVIPYFTP
jgi:hypothetical protein